MELSLPYLTLRNTASSSVSEHHAAKDISRRADLSFLNLPGSTTRPGSSQWRIQEATTSFVICGWSEHRWTGYAFGNNMPPSNEDSDGESSDEEETSEPMPQEDLFASLDGDNPRYIDRDLYENSRRYFLCCIKSRIGIACREWTYLIYSLEHGSMNLVSHLDLYYISLY